MTNYKQIINAFVDLLSAASNISGIHWYRIYDHPKDSIDHPTYKENILSSQEKAQRTNLNKMSLRLLTGLNRDQYLTMLVSLNLLQKKGVDKHGDDIYWVAVDKWNDTLLPRLESNESIKLAKPRGAQGSRYYIPLGPRNTEESFDSPTSQVNEEVFEPLSIRLASVKRKLHRVLNITTELESDSSSSSSSSSNGSSSSRTNDDDNDDSSVSSDDSDYIPNSEQYPIINGVYGIEVDELSERRIQVMIGELVKLQRKNAKNNSTNDDTNTTTTEPNGTSSDAQPKTPKEKRKTAFVFSSHDITYNAIPVPIHKNEEAYKAYQVHSPYVKAIRVNQTNLYHHIPLLMVRVG